MYVYMYVCMYVFLKGKVEVPYVTFCGEIAVERRDCCEWAT